jgi:hypothetical protein
MAMHNLLGDAVHCFFPRRTPKQEVTTSISINAGRHNFIAGGLYFKVGEKYMNM